MLKIKRRFFRGCKYIKQATEVLLKNYVFPSLSIGSVYYTSYPTCGSITANDCIPLELVRYTPTKHQSSKIRKRSPSKVITYLATIICYSYICEVANDVCNQVRLRISLLSK